jgi:stage IV sporulation protein FB
VLLQEPPRSEGDLNFRLFRIPVRIHPFFWVIMVLLGPLQDGPKPLIAWVAAVLLSIMVHELGHAAAMRSYGIYPSIVLYGMGGLTIRGPQAFRSREPGPSGNILIALAGPAAGFGLAALLYAVLRLAHYDVVVTVGLPRLLAIDMPLIVSAGLSEFVYDLFQVNILWGMINLLPIIPLDGGHIAAEFFQQASPVHGIRVALMVSSLTAVFVAIYLYVELGSLWTAIFFGYLGFMSMQALAAYGRY